MSQLSFSSFDVSLMVRDAQGRYLLATTDQILEAARQAIEHKMQRGEAFSSPAAVKEYLCAKLAGYEHEVFAVLFLDSQHRLIEYAEMFRGIIDSASVYPRELVKEALRLNAAAVIVSHNHPSGNPHTHLIVRGRDDTGKDLIIAGDYIADGFRHRASELATEWLGPRTELKIQQTLQREVEQERWTSLAAKGLADELRDRGYLVIDGVDGKAHYVALNARVELANYPTGAVVEVKGSADMRAADKNIAALANDGLYRTDHHLTIAQGQAVPGRDPQEVVAAHVRRLEALRRAGIVERVTEGLWKVPDDLAEQGRRYDAQRLGGVAVELKSHLPIERQARVIGATWLDQQLIGGGLGLGGLGFGSEVKDALQKRVDFLAEQGLVERRGQRVILARNLLNTLRSRELAQVAKDIAAETGLEHRPVADGRRVAGIYRRSVMLASGRYAMLDDGMGFSLVPWKPVIEQRLGQQIATTMRDGVASWDMGRGRGMSIR